MYRFVDEAECKRYRSDCSCALKGTCDLLKKKGIIAQFTLVGSGARNMVTRNGNGPFDLDYNLEIVKAPDKYWNDLRYLKETVRFLLNKAEGMDCFPDSHNSTSCLTTILYFDDEPDIEFSFDVAIVTKNSKGRICKLRNNKNVYGMIGIDQYVWNEIPNSHNISKKVKCIKSNGKWTEVRERYVELKNQYLSRNDKNHPSFTVYIEAVNQIYNKYFF